MFKYIKNYLRNYRNKIIILAIMSIISSCIGIVIPYVNGLFLDSIIKAPQIASVIKFAIIIFISGLCGNIVNYIYNIMQTKICNYIIFDCKLDILEHIRRLPLVNLINLKSVYLSQRINIDINCVFNFALNNIFVCIIHLISIFIITIALFIINIKIACLSFIFIACYILSYKIMKTPIYKRSKELKEEGSIFYNAQTDQFDLLKEIKAKGDFAINNIKLQNFFNKYFKVYQKNIKITTFFNSLDGLIANIFQCLTIIVGGIEIIANKISVGEFSVINSYYGILMKSVRYFFNLGQYYQDAKASYKRLLELLEMKEEMNGSILVNNIEEIKLLSLKYNFNNNLILRYPDYNFYKGNIYGIIGSNGSGKSTFINIIIGLLNDDDSLQGKIFYDNKNIFTLDLYYLRHNTISILLQNEKIAHGNISEIFNDIEMNLNDVIDEIKRLNIENIFLCSNFNLLNLWNKNVKSVSGGELQKLLFLRCIIKRNTNIIIMDEPTSNMDKQSIQVFSKILISLKINKIIIIIMHEKKLEDICDYIIKIPK